VNWLPVGELASSGTVKGCRLTATYYKQAIFTNGPTDRFLFGSRTKNRAEEIAFLKPSAAFKMKAMRQLVLISMLGCWALGLSAGPTFHKDVEPILQKRCQSCHRPGEIGPMPLLTYQQVRPWAKAIQTAVVQKKMPPWFADPAHGKFRNDCSLSKTELDTLTSWVGSGAPAGNPKDAPAPIAFEDGWRIGKPDAIITIPKAFHVPASGTVHYQYITVPTNFTEDVWVRAAEVRPSNRRVVHHIIATATPPDGARSKMAKPGEFFSLDKDRVPGLKPGPEPPQFAASTEGETLQVYVPGGTAPDLPDGQARLIKAGSSIFFQLHYTPTGKPEEDQTSVGLIFAKEPPKQRVKGILVFNQRFAIPAGDPNFALMARAEVTSDVRLISMLPHMHLRGKDFEYRATYPSGETEILLKVPRYDFNWQINYYLAEPKLLPKGTILECFGHYDNSSNNPNNPDPKTEVYYGEQTWDEMLNGFMEVSLEPVKETPKILGPVPGTAPAVASRGSQN